MINGFGRRGFYNTQEIGLGRCLVRKQHTVTIYKCLKKSKGVKQERIEIEPGLSIYYLPVNGLGAHGYLGASVIDKDLDGILCFSDNQIFLMHIYNFCRKNRICFVPYIGTTFSLHKGIHRKVMDFLFASGTLKIYKRNPVIAKTEGAKRELELLGVKNVEVAPVGLDEAVLKTDFKSCGKEQIRKKYGFKKEDVIICNVARMEPEKRTMDLLDIFLSVKDKKKFKLLLVGEGPLRNQVEDKIAANGIEDRVKMISRIPYKDMWEIYTISDYFVNLNKGEIFGMAIMEAIYYETSVAAINAPGPSLTLQGMKGHCLCTNDQEMEQWLLTEYPPAAELEESAKNIIKKFSWNRCADIFVRIVGSKFQREREENV